VPEMSFAEAIDDALGQAMAIDPRIVVLGVDVHMLRRNLYVRFGKDRVRAAPISEGALVGAAVTASMAGLRPVVELLMIDFVTVAMDGLMNHAAKLGTFSGGRWNAPVVLRASCGGGYGDAGQHEQTLWGWLAHIPGLVVVVPSTPADAGGLMLSAIEHDGPVVYLEHKLLADYWLETVGSGGRDTVEYDVPEMGARGSVPSRWEAIPPGKAVTRRDGGDLTIISVGVGTHRAIEAAVLLEAHGINAGVIDLRSVSPLDTDTICQAVSDTGRMLVVDEDYEKFGLSGELGAVVLEAGIPVKFARCCTRDTIPYSREREDQTLPNLNRITHAALRLMEQTETYATRAGFRSGIRSATP
jgi:pyruvate/2-oxoglutarate/acetoin dehydrogenase E1 component